MNPKILRLLAELQADRKTFVTRMDELSRLALQGDPSLATCAQAAVALHHGYGAVESALSRVARFIDGSVPDGPDWHQALLESMALSLEGLRPAILSPGSLELLRRLLGFRHFFRHAYAAEWDSTQLEALQRKVAMLRSSLEQDFDRLETLLRESAR